MPRRPRTRVPGNAAALTDEVIGNRDHKTRAYYTDLTKAHSRLQDLPMDPDREPWDIQPGETHRQYSYFQHYLDSPAHARSIQQTAAVIGKTKNYIWHLSSTHHWNDRVMAYDAEQRRRYELELEAERKKLIRQHLRVSEGLFTVVLRKIAGMDADQLTARDIGPVVTAAGDLARKALGMDDKQGPRISVQAQAVSAAAADAKATAAGSQVEARAMMDAILVNMETMAAAMTPEQRADALATWEAAGIIESEAVET